MKDENVGEKNFRYITKEFKFIINPIAPITGYLTPQQIEIYLNLFRDEKYLQIKSQDDFKEFLNNFKSKFKS